MKMILLTAFAFCLCSLSTEGAAPQAGSNRPPSKRAEFIKKFDRNGNGKLDKAELEEARKAHQAELLKRYDKNGNGKIDDAEREAAREEFRRQREQDNSGPQQPPPQEEPKKESPKKQGK